MEINKNKALHLMQQLDNWELELEQENIKKVPIADVFKKKQEKYEFLKANNWMLWPTTPFEQLDKLTKWFKKWWLVWIWAYSNTWKSQLSYYYAQHFLKQWLEVAYFSLEVAAEDVLIMINQYYHWVDYKTSWSNTDASNYDKLNIYDVWDYYKIDDIDAYVRKFKPDVIFIDFIQILEMKGATEYEQLSSWIRQLQRLAIETWTTIIYLSQVSNSDSKEANVLEVWLKGSWNLIASSDYVFIMKKWNEEWQVIFWLKKNKHWPAYKTFSLYFDFENWKCNFDWDYIQTNKKGYEF